MTSQLNVDTIKGKSTAGSISIQGEGSKTTNLQQGLVKAWWSIDGVTSTAVFRDSFNCTSVTDNTTGDYTANFTNNMNNDGYGTGSQGRRNPAVADNGNVVTQMGEAAPTTSSLRHDCARADFAAAEDIDRCNALLCGDLA
jgi:hypothetical protein